MASKEEKQFAENVKFLYRSHEREPGKRKVKPNLQLLEMDLNIAAEDSSDDSDYKVGEESSDNDENPDEDDDDGSSGGETESSGDEKEDCKDEIKDVNVLDRIPTETGDLNGHVKVNVCNICLGDVSIENDEIVECDYCGVTVHEGCYGVSDTDSVMSTGSSASTEPWFCDSCKAGVERPRCELCPNSGGIFKETDAGKWVHLVCALYTPGCAFGSVEKLTPVTLFEMQYSKWGAKACHLCEDPMLARTGVTINCDAGMCKIFFHVTCAQRMGLLSDANPEYIADPFFAHCKIHVDKVKMRNKKRNWHALQHQQKKRLEAGGNLANFEMKDKERVIRKLQWFKDRYYHNKNSKPKPWLPTQKMPRLLQSSATAIERFRKKAELYGMQNQLMIPSAADVAKKWHIPPQFTVDFVAYFLDRQRRMKELEANLTKLVEENNELRMEEAKMRELLQKLTAAEKLERDSGEKMNTALQNIWKTLKCAGVKHDPKQVQPTLSPASSERTLLKSCKACDSTNDQHQQIECDICKGFFHLYCLNPPLTRFPKKQRGVNWVCEDCDHKEDAVKSPPPVRRVRGQLSNSKNQALVAAERASEKDIQAALRSSRRGGAAPKKRAAPAANTTAAKKRGGTANKRRKVEEEKVESSEAETEDEEFNSSKETVEEASTDKESEKGKGKADDEEDESDGKEEIKEAEEKPEKEKAATKGKGRRSVKEKEKPEQKKQEATEKETALDEEEKDGAVEDKGGKEANGDVEMKESKEEQPEEKEEPVTEGKKSATGGTKQDKKEKDGKAEKDAKKEKEESKAEDTEKKQQGDVAESGEESKDVKGKEEPKKVTPNKKGGKGKEKKVCNKCSKEGGQMVVCDKCAVCFHWACLDPPVKKNPKPRGYTWYCEDCGGNDGDEEDEKKEDEETANEETAGDSK